MQKRPRKDKRSSGRFRVIYRALENKVGKKWLMTPRIGTNGNKWAKLISMSGRIEAAEKDLPMYFSFQLVGAFGTIY